MTLILKEIRKKHDLTQVELAIRLGVSRSTVAQVELGNNSLSLELAKKLSNEFNIQLADLLDGNHSNVVSSIYDDDITGYNSSHYMDLTQVELSIDRIAMTKHCIDEFGKEKNLNARKARFDSTSKVHNYEAIVNIYNETKEGELSVVFLNKLITVVRKCENAIQEDLFNIVSFYYNSIELYYKK